MKGKRRVCPRPPSSNLCSPATQLRPPSLLQMLPVFTALSYHYRFSRMAPAAYPPPPPPTHDRLRYVFLVLFNTRQTLQSSSPSYLLMASLDAARQQAAAGGAFAEPCAAAQVGR